MNDNNDSSRIDSMDQFRGYTVAGMFVVNFLGGMAAIPAVMKHNNTYFSYADSIMPSFMFACGFSYRLTALRRLARLGPWLTYRRIVVRSLALVLVSLMMYGFNMEYSTWQKLCADGVREFLAKLLKANLWEVLAIIGVTQIAIAPIIAARGWVRFATLVGCAVAHVAISYSFNWDFVYGRPNWMDAYWGGADARCWDGGAFGIIAWAIPMLAGTIAYDIVASASRGTAVRRLLILGAIFMSVGYALSCLTRLYDVVPPTADCGAQLAASPVWPPLEKLHTRAFASMLAEPPFVQPPSHCERQYNYWMMGKRVVSSSFSLFAAGFAFGLYGLFVIVSDLGRCTIGVFRTFGQNPLAAYIIHHAVETSIHNIVPQDSPLVWCLSGLALFFAITYLFVRHLERNQIYVRL